MKYAQRDRSRSEAAAQLMDSLVPVFGMLGVSASTEVFGSVVGSSGSVRGTVGSSGSVTGDSVGFSFSVSIVYHFKFTLIIFVIDK